MTKRFPEDPNAAPVSNKVRLDPHIPGGHTPVPKEMINSQEFLGALNSVLVALELTKRLAILPKHGELVPSDGWRFLLDAPEDMVHEYNALVDAARFLENPEQ